MSSINISRNVGIEDSEINVDLGLDLKADVDTINQAKDTVDATGPAEAIARTKAQVAVLDSSITVGEEASLTATETGILKAKAETTSGSADAIAENNGPTGGFIDSKKGSYGDADITIGTKGAVSSTVTNKAIADASAIGGPSDAKADTGNVAGFRNLDIEAGTDARLFTSVKGSMDASASSVGLPNDEDLGNASASAGDRHSSLVGIQATERAGDNTISFGGGGQIAASADGRLVSDAQSVTGNVDASSRADLIAGIAFGGRGGHGGRPRNGVDVEQDPAAEADGLEKKRNPDYKISIGEGGSVSAIGKVASGAVSETVTGAAESRIDIDTIGGIIDRRIVEDGAKQGQWDAPEERRRGPDSSLTIGLGGSVEGIANGNSVASATAVTAPEGEDVVARINHDNVVGIALDKLAIGKSGSLYAEAKSSQDATAKVISSDADPLASVADGDQVVGILDTKVRTGDDLLVKGGGEADVLARLSGKATATAVSSGDEVRAEAGEGSEVAGIRDGKLEIGANIGNGRSTFKVAADSNLIADASATTGSVEAKAGGDHSSVIGLDSLPITVGKSGNIRTDVRGSVNSDASTISGDAEAESIQKARGLNDTTIKIGEDGSVLAAARLTGTATSEAVTGDTESEVKLNVEGIDQFTHSISIGKVGDVIGRSVADGDATATSITGEAEASSSIEARGIHLAHDSVIAIGDVGDVIGTADAGTALLTADSVTGPASAEGCFTVAGIGGVHGGSITAGPNGGDITGTAKSAADLLANTVTGSADASTDAEIYGISHTDLLGGQVGANSINASAEGNYATTSTAVTGDSHADSHVDVGALIGCDNTASLSGDVNAVASLVNDVFASTVTGAATAHASGDVVGISGYDINILGSGSISASVSSRTSTVAQSVTSTTV
jgi:hypothetical protein